MRTPDVGFDIMAALADKAVNTTNEALLGDLVEQAFTRDGIPFVREARLNARDRVDFLVGRIAVELKVDGSPAAILRQLDRYAEHPDVDSIVLVTTRRSHQFSTKALRGKPITVICVGGI